MKAESEKVRIGKILRGLGFKKSKMIPVKVKNPHSCDPYYLTAWDIVVWGFENQDVYAWSDRELVLSIHKREEPTQSEREAEIKSALSSIMDMRWFGISKH